MEEYDVKTPVCRACLKCAVECIDMDALILTGCNKEKPQTYLKCFEMCTQLELPIDDGQMKYLCSPCSEKLLAAHDFIIKARISHDILTSQEIYDDVKIEDIIEIQKHDQEIPENEQVANNIRIKDENVKEELDEECESDANDFEQEVRADEEMLFDDGMKNEITEEEHELEAKFNCNLCPKYFSKVRDLKKHGEQDHENSATSATTSLSTSSKSSKKDDKGICTRSSSLSNNKSLGYTTPPLSDQQGRSKVSKRRPSNREAKPKRSRNTEMWKRNILKRRRNCGQSYETNSKDKKIREPRKIKDTCGEKCKLKCSSKFSQEERVQLFSSFWSLGYIDLQRQYINDSMTIVAPKYRNIREDGPKRPRQHNNAYFLNKNSGEQIRVCKLYFKNTLDINDCMIRTVHKKRNKMSDVKLEPDGRGKHGNQRRTIRH